MGSRDYRITRQTNHLAFPRSDLSEALKLPDNLAEIVDIGPTLPEPIKKAIRAIVHTHTTEVK